MEGGGDEVDNCDGGEKTGDRGENIGGGGGE